jgi:hypothetical protein
LEIKVEVAGDEVEQDIRLYRIRFCGLPELLFLVHGSAAGPFG